MNNIPQNYDDILSAYYGKIGAYQILIFLKRNHMLK